MEEKQYLIRKLDKTLINKVLEKNKKLLKKLSDN